MRYVADDSRNIQQHRIVMFIFIRLRIVYVICKIAKTSRCAGFLFDLNEVISTDEIFSMTNIEPNRFRNSPR